MTLTGQPERVPSGASDRAPSQSSAGGTEKVGSPCRTMPAEEVDPGALLCQDPGWASPTEAAVKELVCALGPNSTGEESGQDSMETPVEGSHRITEEIHDAVEQLQTPIPPTSEVIDLGLHQQLQGGQQVQAGKWARRLRPRTGGGDQRPKEPLAETSVVSVASLAATSTGNGCVSGIDWMVGESCVTSDKDCHRPLEDCGERDDEFAGACGETRTTRPQQGEM